MAVKTTPDWLVKTMYHNGDPADDVTLSKPVKQVKEEVNYIDGYISKYQNKSLKAYDSSVYYTAGALISFNSTEYISLQDDNQGNGPNVSPAFWKVLSASDTDTIFVQKSSLNVPNGVATLDGSGKIPTSQLPTLSVTSSYVVNSEVEMLALVVQEGDIAIRTDINSNFIANGGNSSILSGWNKLSSTPNAPVFDVNTKTGNVILGTQDILDSTDKRYVKDIDITHLNSLTTDLASKEPAFSKNTAFNQAFDDVSTSNYLAGTSGNVSRADHTHVAGNQSILDNATASYTTQEQTKLGLIQNNAQVNVQSDWNSTSGDSQILNKPTNVTTIVDGFMSSTDKTKLDNIKNNANNYILPVSDTGVLGGVLDGTDISIDPSGNVSVVDDSHNHSISTITDIGSASVANSTNSNKLNNLLPTQFLRSDADDTGTNLTLTSLLLPTINATSTLTVNVNLNPALSIDNTQKVKFHNSINVNGKIEFDNGTQSLTRVQDQLVWTNTYGTLYYGSKDSTSTKFETSLPIFTFNKGITVTGDIVSNSNIKASVNTYLSSTDIFQKGLSLDNTYFPLNSSIDSLNDVDTSTILPSLNNTLLWDGAKFVPGAPTGGTDAIEYEEYIATNAQTIFTTVSGYDVGYISVFINGILQQENTYTATDSSTVVLNTPSVLNDRVTFHLLRHTNLVDVYNKTESDTLLLNKVNTSDAVSTNTINKVVKRDGNGNFSANLITASIDGTTTYVGTKQIDETNIGDRKALVYDSTSGKIIYGSGGGDASVEANEYSFLLSSTSYNNCYFDIFDTDLTVTVSNLTIDKQNTLYSGNSGATLTTPNLIDIPCKDMYLYYNSFNDSDIYTIEYSANSGVWTPLTDNHLVFTNNITDLKIKFTWTMTTSLLSFGLLYNYNPTSMYSTKVRLRETYTAVSNLVAPFTLDIPNSGYYTKDSNSLDIFLNGVKLVNSIDYTENTSTSVNFLVNVNTSDVLEFIENYGYIDISSNTQSQIGSLSALNTTIKDNLVNSINEVKSDITTSVNSIQYNYLNKTTDYTCVKNDYIFCDTLNNVITITLPLTPSLGDTVIIQSGDNILTNSITVQGNGNNIILKSTTDTFLIIDGVNITLQFTFDGTSWRVS